MAGNVEMLIGILSLLFLATIALVLGVTCVLVSILQNEVKKINEKLNSLTEQEAENDEEVKRVLF